MRSAPARRAILAAALVVSSAARARAEGQDASEALVPDPPAATDLEPAPPPPAPVLAYERPWYGNQTLLVDGVWAGSTALIFGIGVAGAQNGSRGLGWGLGIAFIGGLVGGSGYLLGPPIVHFAHGNVARGFADLGLRIGIPAALVMLMGLVTGGKGGYTPVVGAAIVGVAGAVVLDASVLAYDPARPTVRASAPPVTPRSALLPATIHPTIAPRTEGGAVLGVSGTLY